MRWYGRKFSESDDKHQPIKGKRTAALVSLERRENSIKVEVVSRSCEQLKVHRVRNDENSGDNPESSRKGDASTNKSKLIKKNIGGGQIEITLKTRVLISQIRGWDQVGVRAD